MIRQHGWARALLFFIAYLGLYFLIALMAGFVFVLQEPAQSGKTGQQLTSTFYQVPLLVVSALAAMGLAFVFRRQLDKQSIASMGFAWRGHQRDAWAGLLLGIVLLGTGSLVLYFSGHIDWQDMQLNVRALLTGLGLMVVTALCEEVIFRGYILNNLLQSMPVWWALGGSALLFAVTHLGNFHLNPIALANLLAGGTLLGCNYVYTRNLWFPVFFHFSWNFFQGPVLGYPVSGLELAPLWPMDRPGNVLLTGGDFGFEGSVLATVLMIMAIFFCLQRRWWTR